MASSSAPKVDLSTARNRFPGLHNKQIFFDNAGGSQVVEGVTDAIVDYLVNTNSQVGASYPVSLACQRRIEDGWSAAARYINASRDEIMLGASATQLYRNLAIALFAHVGPGDEVVVSALDHEANVAPWVQLAEDRGAVLKCYVPSKDAGRNPRIEPAALAALLSPRTKLVACTQTSNVLGTINDVRALADVVHAVPGALFCVDGVAYAPHRRVDVKALGVDFYALSWYKVYGPHISMLYASREAQARLRIIGHPYKPSASLENILGLAAANYELAASLPVVCGYLDGLPWAEVADHEERLQAILIDYLNSKGDLVKIWGEPVADKNKRVPVISFTVEGRSSEDIVAKIQEKSDFGCKWGTFLSIKSCVDLFGLDVDDGVVRVSLVHYNTGNDHSDAHEENTRAFETLTLEAEEEVRGYVKVLDQVITGS